MITRGPDLVRATLRTICVRPTVPERAITMPSRYEPDTTSLRAYQGVGVRWLAARRWAVLGDDMRLGKCAQALRALPPRAPTLVACPHVVTYVWREEVRLWRPDLRPLVVDELVIPGAGEVVIVPYEALPEEIRGWTRLLAERCDHVHGIFDEAHLLKTSTALRTRRARLLVRQLLTAWGLTATPMLGYAEELWDVLQVFGLASRVATRARFLEAFHEEGGEVLVDEIVRARLRSVMLRRTRAEVSAELPARIFQRVPVPAPHALRDDRIDPVARAELARSRIPVALELARQLLRDGRPLVVFSAHVEPVLAFAKLGAGVVTGEDDERADRGDVVRRFKAGELQCIALTSRTGGVGIDLSRSDRILEIDRDWSPAVNEQAYARCEAMTKGSSLLVLQMFSEHRIDRRVEEVLAEKRARIAAAYAPVDEAAALSR